MTILKYIILISIFFAIYFIGNLIAKKYRDRVNELNDFKEFFNVLRSKMQYTYEPLGDIVKEMQTLLSKNNSMKKILQDICTNIKENDFRISWENGINKQKRNLNLKDDDYRVIENFGNMLGKTDLQGQLSEIDLNLTFLENQLHEAEIECRKNEKMYRSLGTIVGLAIVIILV